MMHLWRTPGVIIWCINFRGHGSKKLGGKKSIWELQSISCIWQWGMGPFSAGILERSYLLPSFLSLAKVYAIEGRLKPVNRIFTIPLFFFIYETKMLVIAFSTSSLLFHAVCTRKKCFFSPCIFRALRERERERARKYRIVHGRLYSQNEK